MSVSSWMPLSMAAWVDVQSGAADLADTVGKTFAIRKHATMATVQRDAAPRISGTDVGLRRRRGDLPRMMPGARRAADLRRDPRVAVHCPTEDTPTDDPARWRGDGKITARTVEVEPHRFVSTSNESCAPGWPRAAANSRSARGVRPAALKSCAAADDRAPGRSAGTRWMRDATAAGCGQPALTAAGQRRRCVVIQFIAQVGPPSPENACSNRGSVSSTNQV